jgi:hypothetical protein
LEEKFSRLLILAWYQNEYMKATGKLLFDLGCPQSKIKKLIGIEYTTEEELKKYWKEIPKVEKIKENTIYNYLIDCCNHTEHGKYYRFCFGGSWKDGKWANEASNSQIRNILEEGAIEINGKKFLPNDKRPNIIFDIVIYPNSQNKRRIVYESYDFIDFRNLYEQMIKCETKNCMETGFPKEQLKNHIKDVYFYLDNEDVENYFFKSGHDLL